MWTVSITSILFVFQIETDSPVSEASPHIANIGRMVEVTRHFITEFWIRNNATNIHIMNLYEAYFWSIILE